MRHQDRQRHVLQQPAGNPAEYQLPQPGMTVAADHEKVGG